MIAPPVITGETEGTMVLRGNAETTMRPDAGFRITVPSPADVAVFLGSVAALRDIMADPRRCLVPVLIVALLFWARYWATHR